jgi:toxin FitB
LISLGRNLVLMIFDTNVVSEPIQVAPSEKVMRWLNQLDLTSCFITSITAAELLAGVERLPLGKKRGQLNSTICHIVDNKFAGRVLSFDILAARHFAVAIEKLHGQGLNGMYFDAMIAAIALKYNMPVASRDTQPYAAVGVRVINPWTDE